MKTVRKSDEDWLKYQRVTSKIIRYYFCLLGYLEEHIYLKINQRKQLKIQHVETSAESHRKQFERPIASKLLATSVQGFRLLCFFSKNLCISDSFMMNDCSTKILMVSDLN